MVLRSTLAYDACRKRSHRLSSHSKLPNVLQMQTGQTQSLQHVAGWPFPSLDQWLVPGVEHPALLHEPASLKVDTGHKPDHEDIIYKSMCAELCQTMHPTN